MGKREKAERYLLVAATEFYTHYLVGDRSLDTFTAFVVTDLTGSVIVHDRYQNYDSTKLATLIHHLCCAHLLRDLEGATQVYPDTVWPTQIADPLRGLIHQPNLARAQALPAIPADIRDELLTRLRHETLVGLSDTLPHSTRPRETQNPAATRSAARPPRRHPALRPPPQHAPHLQPGPNTTHDPPRSNRRPPDR
ncbi:MAG: IS66 family transposase [Pseudonocardia sp.]